MVVITGVSGLGIWIHQNPLQLCDEDERGGAHSEKNARCGHNREKKKRAVKPKVDRCV